MNIQIDLPNPVMTELCRLRDAGGRPLLVGGVVRDAMLHLTTRDVDVATTLVPDELEGVFPGVDAALGAVHVRLEDGVDFAVTTLRRDGVYLDQRRPSRVEFVATPEEDAVRRDFTVNAIYADPWSGEVIDPCGGCRDLEDRVLRVIGDPTSRLREDPLRLLRAIRFVARLDFAMEPETASALRSLAGEVKVLSAERVFEELTNSFTGDGRGRALRMLVESGLADHVLPEVVAMPGVEQPPEFHPEGDVFVHVCLVLDHAIAGDPVQAWSAVLHDVGKPATFERAADRIRFSGHDVLSADMADAALHRFRASREFRETVVEVCRDHIRFASILDMKPARRERWMRSPRFAAHLAFHRADCQGSHGKSDIYERARAAWVALPPERPKPLCTGADVLALGVAEGPLVGEVLRDLQSRLDEAEVSDRDTALGHLQRLVEERLRGLR